MPALRSGAPGGLWRATVRARSCGAALRPNIAPNKVRANKYYREIILGADAVQCE